VKSEDEEHWRVVHSTPGRALAIPLPNSLSDEQLAWITSHLPRSFRLIRSSEPVGNAPREGDADGKLEILRNLTAQITEKRLELLRIEQELSTAKVELERQRYVLEERRRHATSFASAFADFAETLGEKFKF
jgi:hypothetical protein